MFASGSQIAQTRPSGTSAVSAFTASIATEITQIVIANTTASPANASIFHDDDGSTFSQATALLYSIPIAAYTTTVWESPGVGSGIMVKPDGQIGVQTGTANALTFTIYGITERI